MKPDISIKGTMILKISPAELEKLVTDYVSRKTGQEVSSVVFTVTEQVLGGYGGDSVRNNVFGGATVNMKPEEI